MSRELVATDEIVRQLARDHKELDPLVTRIFFARGKTEGSPEVRLLEVSGSVETMNAVIAFRFAPRPDVGINFARSIAVVSEGELEALRRGDLDLPKGWGRFEGLEEVALGSPRK